jgi:hypothetical protein
MVTILLVSDILSPAWHQRMYVLVPVGLSGFNLKAIMREAQHPSRTIALRDQDGNPLCITYESGFTPA